MRGGQQDQSSEGESVWGQDENLLEGQTRGARPAGIGLAAWMWALLRRGHASCLRPHSCPLACSLQPVGVKGQASGDMGPPLRVSFWLRPSVIVSPHPPDRDVHRLVFPAVGPQHAGVYKSVIANKLGKAACYAHLYVTGEAGTLPVRCTPSLASGPPRGPG